MAYHLALQASQDKLNTENHQQDADEQRWLVMDRLVNEEHTAYDHVEVYQRAQQECPEAHRAKEAQGRAQEGRQEEYVQQVDQAAREASRAKLRNAVLAWVMPHLDLCHAIASPVRHDRHEAVKLAVQLQVRILDQLAPVRFEAIIDIVQMHAGRGADQPIEDARWKGLRD